MTKDEKIELLLQEINTLKKRVDNLTDFCMTFDDNEKIMNKNIDILDKKVELVRKHVQLLHKMNKILDDKADELLEEGKL